MEFLNFKSDNTEAGVWPDAATFPLDVVLPRQTHTCRVGIIETPEDARQEFADTDALISFCRRLRIGVRTADCVPVLLHAPDIGAVAAVHAGWKGSLGGILTNALDILCERGADMRLLKAGFGPSVCGSCYEVSRELANLFADSGFSDCITGERNLDLEAVNTQRLLAAGVLRSNISPSVACTMQTPSLPSWRRDAGTQVRLLTYIMLL